MPQAGNNDVSPESREVSELRSALATVNLSELEQTLQAQLKDLDQAGLEEAKKGKQNTRWGWALHPGLHRPLHGA